MESAARIEALRAWLIGQGLLRPRGSTVKGSMGPGSKPEHSSAAHSSMPGGKSSDGGSILRSRRRLSGRAMRESCEDSSMSLHDEGHEPLGHMPWAKSSVFSRHRHLCRLLMRDSPGLGPM